MNDTTKRLYETLNNLNRVTEFNDQNKASNPSQNHEEMSGIVFTNVGKVKRLLKKMCNKTSTGWDNIPNIILKKTTNRSVLNYTILFKNCLNNRYFPTA